MQAAAIDGDALICQERARFRPQQQRERIKPPTPITVVSDSHYHSRCCIRICSAMVGERARFRPQPRHERIKPYTLYPTPYTLHPTPYTLHPTPLHFFFFTLVRGPRRSLSPKLSDTRVYEPPIRARLDTTPSTMMDPSAT